jgi:predicted phage terminase large subunit-like protein
LNRSQATVSSFPQSATEQEVIRPQPGPQERALSNPADILFYGGGAGGGKTWTLLLEPIYHKDVPGFMAVMFRRTMPNITNAGSMWDQSGKLYPHVQAKSNESVHHWTFPSGARVEFASLQHNKSVLDWKSSEIALIGFDQIEEFTEDQFWYMTSRNRSTCGVAPYIRCTVNPVPEDDAIGGWVHKLIQWWLDKDTGLPIKERDGVVRWFFRSNEDIVWFDSRAEAVQAAIQRGFPSDKAALLPKSLSFIAARLEDNKKLMEVDPGYYANLMNMPLVERERLYGGNWNVKPTAGRIFNRAWFEIVPMAPVDTVWVRYWDKAGTEERENPNAAFTAGVKLGYSQTTKGFYVGDVAHGQWQALAREKVIKQCAQMDGTEVTVWVEQEPGSGGKESAKNTIMQTLPGYACFADRVKGDKYVRAQPFAAMVQAQNVFLVAGDWNEGYLNELHAFEPEGTGRKDRVDASSGAYNKLTAGRSLELVGGKPLTEEQEQALLDEAAEAARQHVRERGVIFPGEW